MLVCSPVERYYRCRRNDGVPGKTFRLWEYLGITALARVNARLGCHYIVLSQHLAETVRSHGTRARIDVVPAYGVDTSIFLPATDAPAASRGRLGLPPT